jgi:Ser/Thr protein kinase RdoA (MazF antagonist)
MSPLTKQLPGWLEAMFPLANVRCGIVLERSRNTLVRVESSAGPCWLRLATGAAVSLAEANAEATLVNALRTRGISVASAVPRRDGAGHAALSTGLRCACVALLFREAPGARAESLTGGQAQALGALLASIHAAPREGEGALSTARRIDRTSLAEDPLRHVEPWLRAHGLDAGPLRATVREMDALLVRSHRAVWTEEVLCHGDLHLENARFAGDEPTLFDFECSGVGPAIYDLACLWRKNVHGDGDPARARATWDALVRGYRATRPIDDEALAAVPALATLRAIWTMALPALPEARWGHGWLADREYFEAHFGLIERHRALAARPWRTAGTGG